MSGSDTLSESAASPSPVSPKTPPIAQSEVFMVNSPRTSLTPGFLIRGNHGPYNMPYSFPALKFGAPPQFQYMPPFVPNSTASDHSSSNSLSDDGANVQAIPPSQLLPAFGSQQDFGPPLIPEKNASPPSPSSYGASPDQFPVMMGIPPILGTPPPPIMMPQSPMMSPNSLMMCSPQYIQCLTPIEVLRMVAQSLPLTTVVIPPSPTEMHTASPRLSIEMQHLWRGINIEGIPSHKTYSDVMHALKLPLLEEAHLSTDYTRGTARLELRFLQYDDALKFYSEVMLNPVQFDDHECTVSWARLPPISSSLAMRIKRGATRVLKIVFNKDDVLSQGTVQSTLSRVGPIDQIHQLNPTTFQVVFATLDAALRGHALARNMWPTALDIRFVQEPEPKLHKLEEQAALLYLNEPPYETKRITKYSKEQVSIALTHQYLASVLTAQIRGSTDHTGNRCICISRLPANTKLLDICNIVRGGMLESVRILEDLNVCFVIFVEPTAAVRFWANYQMKRLNVNGERVRVGWGRNPGPLAPELRKVIDQGATRNLCLKWLSKTDPLVKEGCHTEEQSRAYLDKTFSPFGTIEQIRIAPEVSCSFISFTDTKNTIQAVSWARESDKFGDFSVQYGKDRCATLPRTSEKCTEATLIQFLRRSLLRSLNNSNGTLIGPVSPGFVDHN